MSKRRGVISERLSNCIKNYFNQTSLHGLHYITDPKSSRFKSYFWTFVCIVSGCLCIILIRSQFISYGSNRITTSISTTAFPIWEVPFPAVTICNFNLVYRDHLQIFENLLEKDFTQNQIENYFGNLSALILTNKPGSNKEINWSEYVPITKSLRKAGYNMEDLMRKVAQPCDQLATDCIWNAKQIECKEIFKSSKSNKGFCCSFNFHDITGGTIPINEKEDIFVSGVGPSFGLEVHLNPETEQYVAPFKAGLGVEVTLHQTEEFPDMSIYSTTIHPGHDVSLSIKPEITESEERVKKVDIKTRGCVFEDEIKMRWASIYSYNTCMNECKARSIMQLCRCVPFYYPVTDKVKFCGLPDMGCLIRNHANIKGLKLRNRGDKGKSEIVGCRCFPQCNEISYSYQLDLQPLRVSEASTNDSVLRVYFGHASCMKIQRSIFFTWELILASIGGLIGLCLGGSILSIIEFFYHFFDAIFTRYSNTKRVIPVKPKKYEPKLYLSDFGPARNLEL